MCLRIDDTFSRTFSFSYMITETGINDLVYNDFYIGENADVVIVAGCGVHNNGAAASMHEGTLCITIDNRTENLF